MCNISSVPFVTLNFAQSVGLAICHFTEAQKSINCDLGIISKGIIINSNSKFYKRIFRESFKIVKIKTT